MNLPVELEAAGRNFGADSSSETKTRLSVLIKREDELPEGSEV